VLVRLLTAGETLGYRAYFAGETYSSTAEALTPARVCFIDKAAVARMLERNPAIGFQFLRRMGEDLREAEDAKLHATALSVRARLAHLLLTLKNRFGRVQDDGTLVIELPLSRQDLAAMVGTRPETIARTIKSMETDEVAIFEGRTVKVSDLDSLLDELEA
jgi:CRP/FNR family transcriptional regulator